MLEKTVLQQLQEIFPMEVNREQADTGEKWYYVKKKDS